MPGDKKQAGKKRDGAMLPLDGGKSEIGGGGDGALVAMLHSLSTRFAPGTEDLRSGFRKRAYEEIRRRDSPLFDHLSALFPGNNVQDEKLKSGSVVVHSVACRGFTSLWGVDHVPRVMRTYSTGLSTIASHTRRLV